MTHNAIWIFPLAGVLIGFALSSAFLHLNPVLCKGYTRRDYLSIESGDLKIGLLSTIFGLVILMLSSAGYSYYSTVKERIKGNIIVIDGGRKKLIDITTITPPKSLDDRYNDINRSLPEIGKAPTSGKPKLVPEELAVSEDFLTQREIGASLEAKAAVNTDTINGFVEFVKSSDLPDPSEYVELSRNPELISSVSPVYPPICVSAQVEGRVFLNLLLDYDGHILKVEIVKSSGNPALDDSAVNAAKQFLFTQAISSTGRPVRVWLGYPITFTLKR